jgi:hypothetical protein
MSRDSFRRILDLIQPDLAGERDNNPVDLLPIHKFCIFLQFMRTNSFQKSVGSQHHIRVAASAACNNINFVAKILAGLVPKVLTEESTKLNQSSLRPCIRELRSIKVAPKMDLLKFPR